MKLYKIFNLYLNTKVIYLNNRVFILKKIISIIYKLNINSKRILFIGISKKYYGILNYIKLRTNHCFIKGCFWLNGLLSNRMIINCLNLSGKFVYFRTLGLKSSFSLAIVLNNLILKNEVIQSNLLTVTTTNHLISKYFTYNINKKTSGYLLILLIYLIIQLT